MMRGLILLLRGIKSIVRFGLDFIVARADSKSRFTRAVVAKVK